MMRETHTLAHGSAHADTHLREACFREGQRITRVEAEVLLPPDFADDAKLVAMKNRVETALPDDPWFVAVRLNQIVAPN